MRSLPDFQVGNEFGWVGVEFVGDAEDVAEGDVGFAAFDVSHVGAVEPTSDGESLLGVAERLASVSDSLAEFERGS